MSSKGKIEPKVSVRIVSADYYMASPICGLDIGYSAYRGLEIKRVPVIRIFGSTSTGFKVCLHVHGILPYFYIPYDGSMPADRMGHQMVMALDKAINVLHGQGTSNAHHIFKASLVSGVPIYGFHRKEHQLFKLYFYNPLTRKHSYDLLLNGAVLHKILQPYEAHIPFILQFMIDFNLQGMNFIHLKSATARRLPEGATDVLPPSKAEPMSTCELELDCLAQDILNSLDVKDGVQMNPGLAALWEEEIERRKVKNINVDNIGPPSSPVRTDVQQTASHDFYKNNLEQQLLEYAKEEGDVSLSFHEVNEQMETTLPVETPEEVKEQLTASVIDFHVPSTGTVQRPVTPAVSEGEAELLDILCDLADEHDSSAPESSRIDDDSILGSSQRSRAASSQPISGSMRNVSSGDGSEDEFSDDEDKVTLEMSQVFAFDDVPEAETENLDAPGTSTGQRWIPPPVEDEEFSSSSTLMDFTLPNLDGADDSSSDETSGHRNSKRKSRSYKPLAFRSKKSSDSSKLNMSTASTSTEASKHLPKCDESNKSIKPTSNETETAAGLKQLEPTSPETEIESSMIVRDRTVNRRKSGFRPDEDEYEDALFKMSLLSSPEVEDMDSPPRPGTPTECSAAQVVIRPLLEDIASYEKSSGQKLQFNSGPVVLKSLEEELKDYQSKSQRKIRLLPTPKAHNVPGSSKNEKTNPQNVPGSSKNEKTNPQNVPGPSKNEKTHPQNVPESSKMQTPNSRNVPDPKMTDIRPRKRRIEQLSLSLPEPVCSSSPLLTESRGFLLRKLSRKPPESPIPPELLADDSDISLIVPEPDPPVDTNRVFYPGTCYTPAIEPPSKSRILETMDLYGIEAFDNGEPFWSDARDHVKLKELRGKCASIASRLVSSLPDFGSRLNREIGRTRSRSIVLSPLKDPPSVASVKEWIRQQKMKEESEAAAKAAATSTGSTEAKREQAKKDRSQLEAPSMSNSFGFRVSFGNCQEAKAVHQHQFLTVLSMELHVSTRQYLRPDPEFDAIDVIFYSLTNDVPVESDVPDSVNGAIIVQSSPRRPSSNLFTKSGIVSDMELMFVDSEEQLFCEWINLIQRWDPDILIGYEIEMLSWGYVLQRGVHLGVPVAEKLSRLISPEHQTTTAKTMPDEMIEGGYMMEKNSDVAVPGRIVLNLWRILRPEIAVQSYTFENMAFHILHRRVPNFSFENLTTWWKSDRDRWQVIEHYATRVQGNLQLLEQLDLIGRTSELARLFGIQFYEVFTRGSQFRVESMMLRLAKPKNFVAVSPSVTQRSRMKAPEWLPLILEPESKFYTDPVLVLDFQSLYPSVIIAYNYCFSTCLGRAQFLGRNEPFEFGCTQLLIPPDVVKDLIKKDLVNVSPAGIVFAKPEVRMGILPQMLSEILNTRIMVKQSMKEYQGDNTLRRVFDSRQLGLKLIANVTYGYTSANFSGRMPCVEVGDSVVSKGRETLERAIRLIETRPEWKARVVYGDTDSVFVLLPGRSKSQAFQIGEEIADAVTRINPKPVKLKFEKVYQPCILQTKKRYVGYKYESKDQQEPVYEAKGIETVRRDGCPAVVKILERSLRVLFETKDVSKVKAYVQRQFSKIMQNRVSIQDYIFAKEFRGRAGYKPGAVVPGLEISRQLSKIDRRSEPRSGERVPYIVVYGSPGVPLIRLVVPAQQLLNDSSLRLNAHYYISRVIVPALQRCFGLLGVDVLSWYQSLPRISTVTSHAGPGADQCGRKATISQYFGTSTCLLCDESIHRNGLCLSCCSRPQRSAYFLSSMVRLREKDYHDLTTLCHSCSGSSSGGQHCLSMDCPVLYRRTRALHGLQMTSKLLDALSALHV